VQAVEEVTVERLAGVLSPRHGSARGRAGDWGERKSGRGMGWWLAEASQASSRSQQRASSSSLDPSGVRPTDARPAGPAAREPHFSLSLRSSRQSAPHGIRGRAPSTSRGRSGVGRSPSFSPTSVGQSRERQLRQDETRRLTSASSRAASPGRRPGSSFRARQPRRPWSRSPRRRQPSSP